MQLLSPEWLFLLPALALLGWLRPALQLGQPLRIACLVLLVFLLCQPRLRTLSDGLELWVLVDQSVSTEGSLQPLYTEWEALLRRSKGPSDRLFLMDYASEAIVRGEDETLTYSGRREHSRLASAIRYTLLRRTGEQPARLLVLSDGYSTEPLTGLASLLDEANISLDYRLPAQPDLVDYRIASFHAPTRVRQGEPFLLEARLEGAPDATIPWRFYRDNNLLAGGSVELQNGRATLRLSGRINSPGAHLYRLNIDPEEDAHQGNNVLSQWVEATGEPRILLVSAYPDDPVGTLLTNSGLSVRLVNHPESLYAGDLSGTRVLILHNVPMEVLPQTFIQHIDFFVRQQGGGFLMVGGRHSFGSGGYYGSTIEDLLPVTTELREDHHQLSVALAIVLDRSGSMNANIPGSSLRKMDLANAGSAQAIEMLGPQDAATVFAVDTSPHTIIPLTQLGHTDRTPLLEMVRRIQSSGGGIFVYTGLRAAWEELQKARQGQRHIILFADAMDAEEPGRYQTLIREMVDAGVTISVIGLGRPTDRDADFLRDIARLGEGRIFFSDNPSDLPTLFAQETIAVARSMFIEEASPALPADGWAEIAPRTPNWLESVDGYNLTYLRPEGVASLLSHDEYQAPLLAHTRRGLGRVAAVTFPLAGDFSTRIRAWPDYGLAISTLVRWLRGDETPPGIALLPRLEGEFLTLELHYGSDWEQRFSQQIPKLILRSPNEAPVNLSWERAGPGRFQARTRLNDQRPVLGAAVLGQQALPFGPLSLGHDPEWDFSPARIQELRALSSTTGGQERLQLGGIWDAPRQESWRRFDPILLLLLLILALADFLHTRLGLRWATIDLRRKKSGQADRSRILRPEKTSYPTQSPSPLPPVSENQHAAPEATFRSRLNRAKHLSDHESRR